MRLSLVLLIAFSCTIKAADEINTEVFGQLKDYILDDPATQGVLISKNNQIIFEEYADGYDQNDLGTTWSLAKTFYAALIGVAIQQEFDVSLEDPIKKFIKPILLRNLATPMAASTLPKNFKNLRGPKF